MSATAVTTSESKSKWLTSGLSLGILANVLWGTSFLASKQTLLIWSPATASFFRFILALLIMAVAFPRIGFKLQVPKERNQVAGVFWIGLVGFGLLYPLQLEGLKHISSSLSASIMLTSPLFVVLLGGTILMEKVTIQKALAVIVGMIGGLILLLSRGGLEGESPIFGSLLTILASLALALSVVVTRRYSKDIDAANLCFWSIFVGTLVLTPWVLLEWINQPASLNLGSQHAVSALLSLFYLASVCSVLCFWMWNKAISLRPAKDLAATMHIKTPVAVMAGVALAGESLTLTMLMGVSLVMAGVALSQRAR